MSIANTNVVAKAAAVVAGLGLVFASFAPVSRAQSTADLQAQIAALLAQVNSLQGQLGTSQSATASVTFSKDLTLGSSGAEVTALQNWLNAKGYTIAAGATGYFGAQTQAALAKYQAAAGITPASGYFGPMTRAKVNAAGGTTTGGSTTGGSTTGSLSGDEADIDQDFDLKAGEDLAEGDEGVEIAIAEFDVEGGDAQLQRVKLEFQAVSSSDDDKPWKYVDAIAVELNGKEIGSADAGSKSDWESDDDDAAHLGNASSDVYTITIPVKAVVEDGDAVELSIVADAQGTIDSGDLTQTFLVGVADEGIRAIDAAGIQQYTGDEDDTITLGFDGSESGDLAIRESDDDPEASILVADDTDTSDEYTVYAFDIKNSDDADSLITKLVMNVGTSSVAASASDITEIIRKATLELDGESYDGDINSNNTITFDDLEATVPGDDTITGTVKVELYGSDNHYATAGETLAFTLAHANVDAEGVDNGDSATVTGSYTGAIHKILLSGIDVTNGEASASAAVTPGNDATKSYVTYTVKFDVTAVENDVYIPATTGTTSGSTTYAGVVYNPSAADTMAGTTTASFTSSATKTNSFFKVPEGTTKSFTLTVTLDPSAQGQYEVDLKNVQFNTDGSFGTTLQSFVIDTNNSDFRTDPVTIPN